MHIRSWALALLLAAPTPAALLPGLLPAARAQVRRPLTLEDIWVKNTFEEASVPGFDWLKDGRYYAAFTRDGLTQFSATTGQPVSTLVAVRDLAVGGKIPNIDGYHFNADEQLVLFSADTEPIYRRSSKSSYYVFDRRTRQMAPLSTAGKQGYATFSPDGKRVAFTRDNNLYVKDLSNGQETAVTRDGERNRLIHGSTDWVYEEEFEFAQAFFWSPDGQYLAYYSFDESRVPTYTMQLWGELYPQDYRYKYPKAGEPNSVVQVSTYALASSKTTAMDVGLETNQYLPRVQWTATPGQLSIRRLNRLQNRLEVLHADAATGRSRVVLTDTDPAYVQVTDGDLYYLPGGRQLLLASERDGFRHLYLYTTEGQLLRQLTQGKWDVTKVEGLDASYVYVSTDEAGPTQRHLSRVPLAGGPPQPLGERGRGTDEINLSPDCRYYLNYRSQVGDPTVVTLREAGTGRSLKTLEDNAKLRRTLADYELPKAEFFQAKAADGTALNGWMLKPPGFDPTRKYPVFMHCYGGPGSQTVKDDLGAGTAFTNYLWHQLLAQQGYVVVSVDGRGTGGRGAAFQKCTYAQLGRLEADDQAAAAAYLKTLPYVDGSRLGLWGWSFGGYLTALTLVKHPEAFKMGISVAPVTNWRYYDTIYTERFLKTPQENPGGYDDNSPVQFAQKLQARYLLVHGTGDDNVHFQNSIAWVDALIKADKPYQTLYYPNRNHSIYGGNTRLHLYQQLTEFVKTNL